MIPMDTRDACVWSITLQWTAQSAETAATAQSAPAQTAEIRLNRRSVRLSAVVALVAFPFSGVVRWGREPLRPSHH